MREVNNIQHKAYKFRISSTKEQAVQIAKTIGCSRFIFNHFLTKWNSTYQEIGKGLTYNRCSSELPALKSERAWLKEIDSIAIQSSVRNVADAFTRFFNKQNNAPRFKSKRNPTQSYTTKCTNGNIAVIENKVKLPKLGFVRFAKNREIEGRILNATIRRNSSGKYFISIVVEIEIQSKVKTGSMVDVDVGLKDFAILSDETVYDNPKFFRSLEKKLAKEQKILSSHRTQLSVTRSKKPSKTKEKGGVYPRKNNECPYQLLS